MEDCKPNDMTVIFCEMCPEEDRKAARKTCMKCEISMCVQHLQAHLTTPVLLQTHPLTDPITSSGATKCPLHGKLVEYYCLDDRTCVCVSCAIEDQHRLHNMKTFSTAHKELLDKLSTDQRELLYKTDDDNVSLEKWEAKENKKITKASVRLIEAITHLRDLTLASVQTSVSARMKAIHMSKNSIQAAQNEKDTYRFLQLYSQVHQDVDKAKSVDLRKGLEIGPDQVKLVKEIYNETVVDQAADLCGSLLMMVDPENHQEIIQTSEDLFFHPEIFSSGISLSTDKREVFYSHKWGQCSATLLIQSSALSDINRWIISFPEDYTWIIGLCDKQSVNNLENGVVYGLSSEKNELSVLSTVYEDSPTAVHRGLSSEPQQKKRKIHKTSTTVLSNFEDETNVQTVEVVWVSSALSFYSRFGQYHKQLIHSFHVDPVDQDLKHFVKVGNDNVSFSAQSNWKCSCGSCHYIENNYFRAQSKCRCGAIIGGISTTELICKLI